MRRAPLVALGILALGLAALGWTWWPAARPAPAPAPPAASSAGSNRVVYPPGHRPAVVLTPQRREPIRSILNLRQPMHFGQWVWDERGIPAGPVWIRVDLTAQILSVFRGGDEIGSTVVLYGAADKPSPAGVFPVLRKAAEYRSRTYDADMPFMLQLTADGVAIHGAEVRRGAATHGCIGVPVDFARRLFGAVTRGDLVLIQGAAS
ncbi:L,D-transpeptidase family protein [Novosphingobium piscinae]|uniref:L,D-transpeptidase family protein n=1 Tax=Novosphingobium piscinae TaxID=1507448 RepID=A0A7X1KNZ6_9SPHN|nr:L,D-transpeptidase family protein [Novosphingobium piscinae]MBC2668157.1 L,D-transpeptidase family protein [Novosphingobium piscinae]